MSCRAHIMRFVLSLPPGTLFTTRQCLNFGFTRNTVDATMARLVKEGTLIRKVRGLFVLAATAKPSYSIVEIAELKATSFGKRIHPHTADSAAEIGLPVEKNKQSIFLVNGCTSRFSLVETGKRIHFRTACEKKMYLENDNVGKAVRGLWHLGQYRIQLGQIADVVQRLKRIECRKIVSSGAWMPHWLMDGFQMIFDNTFRRPLRQIPPGEPPILLN